MQSTGRFRKEPWINKHTGHPFTVGIEPHDVQLFYALAFHYHYLSPPYIAALISKQYTRVCNRLKIMRLNTGHLRLASEQEQNSRNHYWGPLFYSIDKKGIEVLYEHGYEPPKREAPWGLKHQVMVDQLMASIEIGVRANPALELIWFEDIVASDNLPDETIKLHKEKSKLPFLIPITEGKSVHPDGRPFVLKRSFAKPMFFLGFEAETGTQSFSVVKQKLESYIIAIENGTIADRYNTNSHYLIWATPLRGRLNTIKSIWHELTERKPSLRRWMLFTTHPLYNAEEKTSPTGHMVTEPLERVGYPDIILSKEEA